MLSKSISMDAIRLMSAIKSQQLYSYPVLLECRETAEVSDSDSPSPACTNPQQAFHPDSGFTPNPTRSKPLDEELRILRAWLSHSTPFLILSQIFALAGTKSGSKQAKLKKSLIANNLVREHRIQKGKNYLSILEPLSKAFNLIGIEKPQFHSKGGWLHQFSAHHISQWAKSQGYLIGTEFQLSNGKAVDLVLRKDSEVLFVEIVNSKPYEKEVSNILKDTSTKLKCDKLILAVTDSKTRTKIEKLIKSDTRLDSIRELIDIQLIGLYVKT